MDIKSLDHCLTETERQAFEQDGYFIVENALDEEHVEKLIKATDRLEADLSLDGRFHHTERNYLFVPGFVGEDESYIDLVDWYRTFPKVFEILGWNIHLYHSHLNVTYTRDPQEQQDKLLDWHQDFDRLEMDLDYVFPRPRFTLKVGYFLSDCSEPGRGNIHLIPGSHLKKNIEFPNDDRSYEIKDGIPIMAPRGSAVFFDRRIWHSASANYWDYPRKALFYGYGYRWIRARDDVTVDKFWDSMDPIRKQLFGATTNGGRDCSAPKGNVVPLRNWIQEHLGEDAVVA
jgi:ectoine hydroxylase-related dioxygenase (phytanoyl-CoA dioxygenase family)